MKKILLFLLFLTFSTKIFAQLDREHWFAPMMDRSGQTNPYQSIYMSTNEITPFRVDVYSNNVIIGSVMVSKNNPGKYSIIDSGFTTTTNRERIITKLQSDLFKPVGKGIYLKGEKPFFASLRFSVNQHAEIITSKGAAGMGTEFYATPAPIEANLSNVGFMTSIMAKEDGTVVNIDNFNPSVSFSDGVTRSSFTINLNKGQSYIIDGRIASGGTNINTNPNKYGFIGAKITSNADHPITVTNGNFNGQYVFTTASSTDILMDQSVPVDKLGTEFVLVKGNGTIYPQSSPNYSQNMEKAFIVATANGTNIYVNNETTPVNPTPLNAGQHYVIPSEKYILHGSTHRNMYIKSTQNIYVFQLLAGASTGNEIATGGYNYIPPLSCYLPREIDEIAMVSENEGYIDNVYNSNGTPTKLNIITENGAVVTVEKNGIPFPLTAADGPYDITGNAGWVTYSIERAHGSANDVSGNIKVKSTKAVTAGISAGDGAVGYGGYFAGFSYIPTIPDMEGCLPGGVVLKLSEGFDNYKWMFRDKNGNVSVVKEVAGTVPGANIINPAEIGYYWAVVQQGSCDPVTTPEKKVLVCFGHTAVTYDICDQLQPTPVKFSLGIQGIKSIDAVTDPANPTNPSKGQLRIDNVARTISYIPNPGATGADSFWYKITGDDATTPDTEEVHVTINLKNIIANDTIVKGCKIDNVKGLFDISKVNTDATLGKVFYKDPANADGDTGVNTIPITDLPNYQSAEGFVYLRLDNGTCKKTVKVELKFYPKAETLKTTYEGCDLDFKGVKINDFRQVKADLLKDAAYFTNVDFYLDSVKLSDGWTYTTDTIVRMEVISPDGCATQKFNIAFKVGNKIALINASQTVEECDDDFDGNFWVRDLAKKYRASFTSDAFANVKLYVKKSDAQNATNSIDEINVNNQQLLFVRISNSIDCPALAELTIKIKVPKKSDELQGKTICLGDTAELDAGPGFTSYEWYKEGEPGIIAPNFHSTPALPVGKYYVILKGLFPNDCPYKQNVEIKATELPAIDGIGINGSTVKISAKGGKQPYQYAIDGGGYQPSDTFTNVSPGFHKAYVISADDCDPVEKEFSVIEIYNLLTPNGDGVNDVLDMSLLRYKANVKFQIFDRDGQKLFDGDTKNNYIWNGKQNGKVLPTSTYWYIMQWQDFDNSPPVKYTGWILLKNRNND